jgi:hypothetical protein
MRPIDNGRSQARENELFEHLLIRYKAYELERRIQRLESTRKFYRRYPYDAWQKRTGMEAIDLHSPSDPLAEIIADEARNELLDGLTDRERWVAQRAEEGYQPRDMAKMRNKDTSNADRWIKHSVKEKMAIKLSSSEE